MLLTSDDLVRLGKLLDTARNDESVRCHAQLTDGNGEDHQLVAKPGADIGKLRRKLGEKLIVMKDGVPHVVVPLGLCGRMRLGIDPETSEISCTLHGKGE